MKTGQDFEMVSGDSKNIYVEVKDAEGTPKDLSGMGLKWQLWRYPGYVAPSISKDENHGITLIDPVSGKFRIELEPQDTEKLEGLYLHEAGVVDREGNITTILAGNAVINKDLII